MLMNHHAANLTVALATLGSLLIAPTSSPMSSELASSISLNRSRSLSVLVAPANHAARVVVGGGTPVTCTQAALEAALAGAATGDTVTFSCGTSPITLSLSSPITLTRDVTLDGGDAVTLSTNGQGRCVAVAVGVTATLRHLAFRRCGAGTSYDTFAGNGGAVLNGGTVSIENSQFAENGAQYGGVIYNLSGARLTVINSSFSRNEDLQGGGAGGVIYNDVSATAFITTSRFDENYNAIVNSGVMQISDTVMLTSHGRDDAAAIANGGVMTLTHSQVMSSTGAAISPAIENNGQLFVQESTISLNRAERLGSGILNWGVLMLDSSTLSTNTVKGHFSGYGGGLINRGEATITNSTFSDNHNYVGNTGYGGGGILNTGHVTITASTFAGNSPFGIDTIFINSSHPATATVRHTLVVSNAIDFRGALVSQGYNVIGSVPADSVFVASTGDQTGNPLAPIDAKLGPLADNGGLAQDGRTQTHALLPGSPAIDVASANACAVPVDQRGVTRPQGQGCDAGAYEVVVPGMTGPVLDSFNRANGPLLGYWVGPEGLGGYQILGGIVDVLGGGPIYWGAAWYAPAQQVSVTLTRIDPQQREHALLLKVQGNPPNWRQGYIQVAYFGAAKSVQVSTYQPGHRWVDYALIKLPLKAGDRLGAQMLADGRVRILKNDHRVVIVKLIPRDQAFFDPLGGHIGLWFNGYGAPMDAVFDDFGGGNANVAIAANLAGPAALSADEVLDAEDVGVPVVSDFTERDQPRNGLTPQQFFLPIVLA